MNDLIATWVDPANLTRRTTRAAVTGIGKYLGGCFTSGPALALAFQKYTTCMVFKAVQLFKKSAI